MKRMLSLLIALAVVVAATPSFAGSPAEKFTGGVKDVFTSPMEICDAVKAETKDAKFLPFAAVGGLLKGGFYMGKKIVTGLVDIVTSPLEMAKK